MYLFTLSRALFDRDNETFDYPFILTRELFVADKETFDVSFHPNSSFVCYRQEKN